MSHDASTSNNKCLFASLLIRHVSEATVIQPTPRYSLPYCWGPLARCYLRYNYVLATSYSFYAWLTADGSLSFGFGNTPLLRPRSSFFVSLETHSKLWISLACLPKFHFFCLWLFRNLLTCVGSKFSNCFIGHIAQFQNFGGVVSTRIG
jgi:hypothetical protein